MRWKWILSIGGAVTAVPIALAIALSGHGYDTSLVLADLARLDIPLPDRRSGFERRGIAYEVRGSSYLGDIYRPQAGARAGLVLIAGAAEGGRNDARLVEFAGTLARSGFVVLVPDIPSFRQLRPSPDSSREIADAVIYLRSGEGMREELQLGIGAFSIAAGPAILATLERGDKVDFLLLVGGYHDLRRTLSYLTTGYFSSDGQTLQREPNSYGKWVYALSNAGRLPDASEREALERLAKRKLSDPGADVDDLLPGLGPGARAVYEFITNREPERFEDLLRSLPAPVRADIEALDLATRDLAAVQADAILVHGVDDDIIPYTESISLAKALPEGRTQLFLLDGLHHVDRDFRSLDAWRMWRALHSVMSQRS
jgi:pimeloyl-ACP methyl ester carboxylesterase